jgi:hypothetical protein
MKLEQIEQWFDAKSWLGWPRSTWCGVALVVGIIVNVCIIKFVL